MMKYILKIETNYRTNKFDSMKTMQLLSNVFIKLNNKNHIFLDFIALIIN